jgi:hypothetical protein
VLYDVPTRALNQAVKRNSKRFPADFMFRLTREEVETLNRSQIVTGVFFNQLLSTNRIVRFHSK